MTVETSVPVERKSLERPFTNLQHAMGSLLDDWGKSFLSWEPFAGRGAERTFVPSLDLSEDPESIHIKAELPGIDREDIDLSLSNDVLTIRGEKRREEREEKDNFYRVERSFGAFTRSVPLPCEIECEKIEARFKNGVLDINLPKSKAVLAQTRHIDVKSE